MVNLKGGGERRKKKHATKLLRYLKSLSSESLSDFNA